MVDSTSRVRLPDVQPERLRDAVWAVLAEQRADANVPTAGGGKAGRLPSAAQLRQGAEDTVRAAGEDAQVAEYFASLLELGYLVASADGLAEQERDTLAQLVEHATAHAVDRHALMLHFHDLDATVAALGRSERLLRAAASFTGPVAREEALTFAALVAMADGSLEPEELAVLVRLGEQLSLSEREVRAVVDHVAEQIQQHLADAARSDR